VAQIMAQPLISDGFAGLGPAQRTSLDGMAPPQTGRALATPAAVWAIRHKARASCASTMAAS